MGVKRGIVRQELLAIGGEKSPDGMHLHDSRERLCLQPLILPSPAPRRRQPSRRDQGGSAASAGDSSCAAHSEDAAPPLDDSRLTEPLHAERRRSNQPEKRSAPCDNS